jgi:NADPH:quinone reductase-like Zn-dependent oxidoreductase
MSHEVLDPPHGSGEPDGRDEEQAAGTWQPNAAMSGGLDGNVVAITAASSGVGRASAEAFARAGAAVGLIARGEEALRATVTELIACGGRAALAAPADVANAQAQSTADVRRPHPGPDRLDRDAR